VGLAGKAGSHRPVKQMYRQSSIRTGGGPIGANKTGGNRCWWIAILNFGQQGGHGRTKTRGFGGGSNLRLQKPCGRQRLRDRARPFFRNIFESDFPPSGPPNCQGDGAISDWMRAANKIINVGLDSLKRAIILLWGPWLMTKGFCRPRHKLPSQGGGGGGGRPLVWSLHGPSR